ncbi:phosphoglycerate mutase-like protein, partial [Hymenopellis radicata]
MSSVLGVIVITRNGDRVEFYQDPESYKGATTETTPLGEVQSHALGALLRQTYLAPASASYIAGMSADVVDNHEVKVKVKAGGEGTVVFDSAIALLQGLFPPTPKNRIKLADGREVIAPLGGYQYVPVETVEPSNDRSLESWTDCPAFQKHVKDFKNSEEFKGMHQKAQPFFDAVKDYVFGRELSMNNIWNIYDFVNTQLMYNQTYAYRLPPTLAETARGLANWHEDKVFSDSKINGIGNVAGRTLLRIILKSLERIAFNDDPLQFMLVETTYQPFISLFHMAEAVTESGKALTGFPDYASAFAIELRRGSPPDLRDFVRFKFRNGTEGSFETVHVLGHKSDIPLTEFIYKTQGAQIMNNKHWKDVCGGSG